MIPSNLAGSAFDYGPCDDMACAVHQQAKARLVKGGRNPSEDSSVVMAYIFLLECNNSVEYVLAITEDESSRLLLLPHMQVALVTTSAATTGRTCGDQPVVGKGG